MALLLKALKPIPFIIAAAIVVFGLVSVHAQSTPEPSPSPDIMIDVGGGAASTCLTTICEPYRVRCVQSAGTDQPTITVCLNYLIQCEDSCNAGGTWTAPPVPVPAPQCLKDEWACGPWTDCDPARGVRTRACDMTFDCPDIITEAPVQIEKCVPEKTACTEDKWECGPWGECSMGPKMTGERHRSCRLTFDCLLVENKRPAETEGCQLKERSIIETADTAPAEPPESEEARPGESAPAPTEAARIDDTPAVTDLRTSIQDFEKNTENVSGGFGLIGSGGGDAGPRLVSEAEQTCQNGGIPKEECDSLLKKGLGFEDCAAAGFMTRESCQSYLQGRNGGVFPGCEGQSEARCEALKKLTTLEYVPKEIKEKTDAVIEELIAGGMVVSLPGLMATNLDPRGLDWWRSAATGGGETAPGVVVKDSDNDNVPDDLEILRGSDPHDADSDDDGLSDQEELQKETLDPVEATIAFRKPLEQPRGAGEVDPDFGILLGGGGVQDSDASSGNAVRSSAGSVDLGRNENWDFGGQNKITGKCLPNSTCLIFIYSYIPMVITVKTDASGNFVYDFQKDLADGSHVAYVAVTDDSGKIQKKSGPLSFFIKEAQAASEEDFLSGDINVAEPAADFQRYYMFGTVVLVAVAGLLVWQVGRKMKGSV